MSEQQPTAIFTSEDLAQLEQFSVALMLGPPEYFALRTPPDDYTSANAQDYFLAAALVEVQRAGMAATRWSSVMKEINSHPEWSRQTVLLRLAPIIPEQSIWRRKLAEALTSLVCLSTCNDPAYYYHYLLIVDYLQTCHEAKEQKDFFGSDSSVLAERARQLRASIDAVEHSGGILANNCWYLKSPSFLGSPKKGTLLKPGNVESTFRGRLMVALAHCDRHEQRALGYCYQHAFSTPSSSIHFSPVDHLGGPRISDFTFACSQIPLLGLAILSRAHRLVGVHPAGLGSEFARRCATVPNASHPFVRTYAKANFVVVTVCSAPYLAEILDVATGTAGSESYRVRFLDELPLGTISEDWVRVDTVGPFLGMGEMTTMVKEGMIAAARPGVGESPEDVVAKIPPEEIQNGIRRAVVHVWKEAMRDHYKRELRRVFDNA